MRQREYQQDVRPAALRDELGAAGVPVVAVRPGATTGAPVAVDLDVAPDDTSQDAATDAVVGAHDPQAIDAKAQTAKTTYDQAVDVLKQFHKLAPGTATNVQRDRAIQALTDVSKKLNADLRELGEAAP